MQMHRMKKERFELITYQESACEVLKTIRAVLEEKTPRDVRIQYRDDEDTLVNLSCDEDLIDACRYLRPVENSSTPRTCIDYQLECMLLLFLIARLIETFEVPPKQRNNNLQHRKSSIRHRWWISFENFNNFQYSSSQIWGILSSLLV